MTTDHSDLPDYLLQAVADRSGRITLVVGAGCSLEPPTNLKLAREYSLDVHAKLVRDGVLADGDCPTPEDLSAVTSAVWAARQSQAEVVTRLPRPQLRNAKANDGYRAAVALMRAGAVSAVLSLNFDLALSDALSDLSADEVAVIAGPDATRDLGTFVAVYLHRNVNEEDPDLWILRLEALESEWRGRWEEVLSQRLMSSPVIVFAGLGSPAAVLTQTVAWIRQRLDPDQHRAYVVDPATNSEFKDALDLPEDAQIQVGWCAFMALMADRLGTALTLDLRAACASLCDEHGWADEQAHIDGLLFKFFERGLVESGSTRAKWLLRAEGYTRDEPSSRGLVADLLLGLGLVNRLAGTELTFRRDGVADLRRNGQVVSSLLPVSGGGTLRWAAIEARAKALVNEFFTYERPHVVLVAGMPGAFPEEVAPPDDVVLGDAQPDVVGGFDTPIFVTVDGLRADPATVEQIAS